jgi:hypothetical protein
MSIESHGGNILTGVKKNSDEKPVQVPVCPPQILHGLTWARTLASAARGWQLIASAMARTLYYSTSDKVILRHFSIALQSYITIIIIIRGATGSDEPWAG